MKKWIGCLLVLVCSVIFSACGGGASEKKETETAETVLMTPYCCEVKNGLIFSGNTDKPHFYDSKSGETQILEDTPEYIAMAAFYQDDFYYVGDGEDGTGLYRLGEEGGLLSEVDMTYSGIAFGQGKVYLTDNEVEAKDGGVGIAGGRMSLFSLDLETGEKKILEETAYGEDQMMLFSMEHIYDGNLYYRHYVTDIYTGELTENGWYKLDMATDKIEKLELEEFARTLDWKGKQGVCAVDPLEIVMSGQEEWGNSYYLVDLETGKRTEMTSTEKGGPGLQTEEGFIYIDWDPAMTKGTWKLYKWKDGSVSEFLEFEPSEETLFYPEACVKKDGEEMLVGRHMVDGTKGHYMISVKDFLEGNDNYELLCAVNAENQNWIFTGSR